MSKQMETLGRDVREALGDGPSPEQLAAQRAAIVGELAGTSAAPRTRLVPRLGLGLSLAAACVLGWFAGGSEMWDPPAPICEVRGHAIEEGAWLEAGAGPLDLRFSEGTRITLEDASQARLSRLSVDRVNLSVASGATRASVTSGQGITWTFEAGPYRVIVVGTELRVQWDADGEQLLVGVTEGRVRVEGGGIAAAGIPVSAGQRLRANHRTGEVRLDSQDALSSELAQADGESRAAEEKAPDKGVTQGGKRHGRRAGRTPEQAPKPPTWKELADRGDYAAAVDQAEQEGLDALIQSLPPWDLMLLGDACRFAERVACAKRALNGLRSRHEGHRAARVAAFRLGRVTFDQERNYRGAARWFRTYLAEAPQGRLAEEARGRLMDALRRSGDRTGARRAAREYLERHPEGAYARPARALLEGNPE